MNKLILLCGTLLLSFAGNADAQTTWYVPDDFSTIQAGIDGAANGDIVIVRDGTYVENINFNGKAITLKSENGPGTTIIDGNDVGSVVTFVNGEAGGSVLDGLWLDSGYPEGVYCNSSAPTILNCRIQSNERGMFCFNSSPILENCLFQNNHIYSNSPLFPGSGGALYCENSSPTLTNCHFRGNVASQGGAIYCLNSAPKFQNCIIENNTVTPGGIYYGGGGMYCENSNPILANCIFDGNFASFGGGLLCERSAPVLNNCTILDHDSTLGGGLFGFDFSSPTLTNCIFSKNDAAIGQSIYIHDSTSSASVAYSNVEGGWPGTGNIDTNPLFFCHCYSDVYLRDSSPCIDSGDPSFPLDPDGTRADMGAYYFDHSAPNLSVTNLGAGQTTLVEIVQATPNNIAYLGWSFANSGSSFVNTPYGRMYVDHSYSLVVMQIDASGNAAINRHVPASLAGNEIWFHGVDIGSATRLNPVAKIIH